MTKSTMINLPFHESLSRIKSQIEEISEFNSTPEEGITRIVYTKEDLNAKTFIKNYMMEVGLEVSEDAIGNIFGRLEGTDPGLPSICSGSHLDAPLNSGMFDGIVGVVGAIEALRIIKESGLMHKHSLEVIVFASEEPTRFGVGCLGSRALTGQLSPSDLKKWRDKDGNTLFDSMKQVGYSPEKISEVCYKSNQIDKFIELHIEQGPVLESTGKDIGLVEVIAAPTEILLTIIGEQRHAGSTPMNLRKDPVPAAAEIILELEKWVNTFPTDHTVSTVGSIQISPGTSNVIGQSVTMTIDSRDMDEENKDRFLQFFKGIVDKKCRERGLSYHYEVKTHDKPAFSDRNILDSLIHTCDRLEIPYQLMPSGAYHDSMMMSSVTPFGMIFVPSKNGISHDKEEWTDYEQIVKGIEVLTYTLYELAK